MHNDESCYVVYKTDKQHSYQSRELIGMCFYTNTAISIIKEKAEKEGYDISSDEIYNLRNLKQTQYYEGEGQFVYEETEFNKLI